MRILGIDPGYRNLGLAIIDIQPSGAHIVWSENMSVGSASNGLFFVKFLWPKLDELYVKYGIEGLASETPPFIMKQVKTTALLWAVSTITVCWAYHRGLPFRHASPISIKKAVARALGLPWRQKSMPKKKEVREAVIQYTGNGLGSHENDAVLSAILLYSNLIPK